MPYKRRSYRRKRRPRRRRRYSSKRMVLRKAPLFGKRKVVRLRYSQTGQLQLGPGAFDEWVCKSYRANAAGRPAVSGSVTLPEGWDLISPLFSRAYTLCSKITVVWLPGSVGHSACPWVEKSTVALDGQNSPQLQQILANKFVNYGFYASGAGGTGKLQRSMKFSTKSWFSTRDVLDDTDLSQEIPLDGLPPVPPAREAYYNVGWTTTHSTTQETANRDFLVIIDYVVAFVGPRNVA